MRDTFPFLDSLVLPTDAVSGARLEISSIGEISIYDSNDNLRVYINPAVASAASSIAFPVGDPDEDPNFPGRFGTRRNVVGASEQFTSFVESGQPLGEGGAELQIRSESADGTTAPASIELRNNGAAEIRLGMETQVSGGIERGIIGQATLVAGTITVNHNLVAGASRIYLSRATTGGTLGHLSYTTVSGTSFTINSSSATDTSVINWMLIHAL